VQGGGNGDGGAVRGAVVGGGGEEVVVDLRGDGMEWGVLVGCEEGRGRETDLVFS
jgi:hypothetical protein